MILAYVFVGHGVVDGLIENGGCVGRCRATGRLFGMFFVSGQLKRRGDIRSCTGGAECGGVAFRLGSVLRVVATWEVANAVNLVQNKNFGILSRFFF